MRWNCPHCGVALAVSDEKLSSSWTFSRCYQCSGFALVRKPEVSLIKVDHAPTGEKLLLPEGTELPAMSESATQHLASIIENGATPKPTIVPSKRHASPAAPTTAIKAPSPIVNPIAAPTLSPAAQKTSARIQQVLPIAMIIAGFTALGSGFYLYRQGQAIYSRTVQAQPAIAPKLIPTPAPDTVVVIPPQSQPVAPAHQEQPVQTQAAAPQREPAAPSVLPGLVVRPKSVRIMLRVGPGEQYKELGYANPSLQYVVTDWKDRWFKVMIQNSRQTAWVKNDNVDLTPISAP